MNHIIQTTKFHRIIFKKIYIRKIKPEDQTIRNLLSYYLSLANNKYPKEDLFNLHLAKLYDSKFSVNTSTYGAYSILSFTMSSIDPKYINDSNYTHLDLMNSFNECLNPVIIDNNFDEKLFKKAYDHYMSSLLYELEDDSKLALKDTISTIFNNTIRDFNQSGDIKSLKCITCNDLYNYYLSIINDENISYCIGDVINYYKEDNLSNITLKDDYLFKNRAIYPSYLRVEKDCSQAYINIVYDMKIYSNEKLIFPMMFLDYHFGGSNNSKLFRIVREKYGLCYSISSSYYGASGILVASIIGNIENKDKILNAVSEAYETLLDDFNLEEIKKSFILERKEASDYMVLGLNKDFYSRCFKNYLNNDEEIKIIKEVSMEDIYYIYNKMKISLVHVYGGNNNE